MIRGEVATDIFEITGPFRRANTKLYLVNPGVEITSDDFATHIMTLMRGQAASGEVKDIKRRTMAGKEKRLQEGRIPNYGREKYGYRRIKETGKAEIREDEAIIIRRAFAFIANRKGGLLTLAQQLNLEAVPSPSVSKGYADSGKWSAATLRNLLHDPAYKGEPYAWRHVRRNKRVVLRPETEWRPLPADCYPVLVDAAQWDKVQRVLATNRGVYLRNQHHPTMLRGLVVCAKCGRAKYFMKHVEHRADGLRVERFYYRCASGWASSQVPRCGGKESRAEKLEAVVWERLAEIIRDPALYFARAEKAESAESDVARMQELQVVIAKKETQQANLLSQLRDASQITGVYIQREIERLDSEKRVIQSELLKYEVRQRRMQDTEQERAALIAKCQAAVARLHDLPVEIRRDFLLAFNYRVEADGLTFEFITNLPA